MYVFSSFRKCSQLVAECLSEIVAKSSLSIVDGEFHIEGNYLESAGLRLGIRTRLVQTHGSAQGEHLTNRATKPDTFSISIPSTRPHQAPNQVINRLLFVSFLSKEITADLGLELILNETQLYPVSDLILS